MNDTQSGDEHNRESFLPISEVFGDEGSEFSLPAPKLEGYEILHKIGEAGQGQVWKALQLSTNRKVALKVPRFHGFGARKAFRRFEREIQVAARLKHPNIARIYDSGVNKGLYYYTMEFVDGRHLDRYVAEKKLSQKDILILIRRVALAIQYAHQNAVIHRDLKPSNILVTSDGQPHIVDFGLAKGLAEDDMTVTISQDDQPAGTPAYMSPEQAAGSPDGIDTRTDIYSIGVILYQMLTGALPHDMSGGRQTVLNRIAHEPIIRPQLARAGLDKELGYLLQKALAEDPPRRYSTAAEFAQDIENYLDGLPLIAGPESAMYITRKYIQRHKGLVYGSLAGLIALVGGLVSTSVLYHQTETARKTVQVALDREERLSYSHVIQLADLKIKAGDYRGVRSMLENTNPRLRNWEWGYLYKQCQKPQWFRRIGSIDAAVIIDAAAISEDGRYLMIHKRVTPDIILLNTDTGDVLWQRTISTGVHGWVQPVFTRPGNYLVVETHNKLLVIEAATGNIFNEIEIESPLSTLQVGDNRLYAGFRDGLIRCYETDQWQVLSTIQMDHRIRDMAVSPENDRLAVITGLGHVSIHDALTLEKLSDNGTVTGEGVRDVLILPEINKLILAAEYGFSLEDIDKTNGDTKRIYTHLSQSDQGVREVADGVIKLVDHTQNVYTVAVSSDHSKLITGSHDGTANIYDTETWDLLGTIFDGNAIFKVFMLPNDKIITVGVRGEICLWSDFLQPSKKPDVQIVLPKSVGCWELDYQPDGSRVALNAWGYDQIVLADAQTGDLSFIEIDGYAEEVEGDRSRPPTFFRPQTSELVVKVGNTLRVHDVALDGYPEIRRFQTPKEIYHAAMDPLGECVAVCYKDGAIDAISLDHGFCSMIPFDADRMSVSHIAFSWDGSVISLLEEEGQRRLLSWDRWTGEKISSIKTGFRWYSESLAFHPDGQIVAIGNDEGDVYLWDIFNQQQVCKLSKHGPEVIHSLLFTPDGERLISGGHDNTIRFWDWKIQKNLFTIDQGSYPLDICFSPDGLDLACSDGRPAQAWIRRTIPDKQQ